MLKIGCFYRIRNEEQGMKYKNVFENHNQQSIYQDGQFEKNDTYLFVEEDNTVYEVSTLCLKQRKNLNKENE